MLKGVSRQTIRAYAFDLLTFHRFLRESCLTIETLQLRHVADFLLFNRKAGMAPRTINRRLIVVRYFLNVRYNGLGDELFQKTFSPFYKGRKNNALLGDLRLQGQRRSLKVKVPAILITPLSPTDHRLRHTYAASLLSGGVGLIFLMKLLGHRRIEMTLRYAKVTPSHLRNEIDLASLSFHKKFKLHSHHMVQ